MLRILGAKGRIEVPDFWFAGGNRDQGLGQHRHHPARRQARDDQRERDRATSIPSRSTPRATPSAPAGRNSPGPGMSWADSLGNAARARQVARGDRASNTTSKSRRGGSTRLPAAQLEAAATRSRARSLPGLRKQLSVVALGFEDFRTFSSGAILLDAFLEAGGNLFDTAFVYGARIHGKALRRLALRTAACARSRCSSAKARTRRSAIRRSIGKQLAQSLDRLQTDYVDIYFMHRDNPDVPVGEFVDAMDAEVRGRPHPRAVRRFQLDARTDRRGDRLCGANGQAEARRTLQQFFAGRDAGCRSGPAA